MAKMKVKMFVLGFLGTNGYVVFDEESKEAMVIDPGAYDAAVTNMVEENGLVLKYIALTHGHGDHIGGVQELKDMYPDAILAAGDKEDVILGSSGANASKLIFGKGIELKADLALKEGDELTLGDLSFEVIETPGHTPGGISFYIPECDPGLTEKECSGTVFTGDTLFHTSIGRTDLPGGDFETLISSIRNKLFALPDDTLALPGHMDATTVGYEKQYNMFVK